MARLGSNKNLKKPWKAEVKHNYQAIFLGYFSTKGEAEEAERYMRLYLTGVEYPMFGGMKRRQDVAS